MRTLAAIGVDDNLAACEPRVSVGAADNELAGGVDVVFDVVVEEGEHFLAELCFYAGDENVNHILADLGEHLLVGFLLSLARLVRGFHEVVVLGGDHDRVDALRHAAVAVLDRHLALGIGAEIGHHLAFLAYVGQGAHDEVRQVERGRHVVFGLVGGIAEHHALVAGPLVILLFAGDATVDVVALLVDSREHAARVAVELIVRLRVAYLVDGLARDGLQVDISL